jgi:hypothetical protein
LDLSAEFDQGQQARRALGSNSGPGYCAASLANASNIAAFLAWSIVEIPDGGVDLVGFLEGAVKGLKLTGRTHLVDGFVDGRDGGKGPLDGNGVRRQADAAPIGELLKLGRDRQLVDDDGLLPLV